MMQPRRANRILLALVLCSSWALCAYGRPSSFLRSFTGQTRESMSFLVWIVLGLIAGFIGSKIVNSRGEGILLDILLGVVGAFAGGWLFHMFGEPGVKRTQPLPPLRGGNRLDGFAGSLSRPQTEKGLVVHRYHGRYA
jgi:uncharacterized membrane protein YeaQ/YmgE (transglycosylase-associated protein family)